ncbi:hypothetical protein HDU97_010273 [Phlyctochytrium planicorne]|nr:hypothetical protein HDU97_010273 [Phlyctochytrium planicorne]
MDRRPLNLKEANYLLNTSEHTNFAYALKIQPQSFGDFETTFQNAVNYLPSQHPILESRIESIPEPKGGHKLFFVNDKRPITIRIIRDGSVSVHALLREEINNRMDVSQGLFRVVLLKPEGKEVHVVFTFAHCGIDGRGGMEVVKDWVKAMEEHFSSPALEPLSKGDIPSLIPSFSKTWRTYLSFLFHIIKTLSWIHFSPPPCLKTPSRPITFGKEPGTAGNTTHVGMAFTKSQTAELVGRARALGVSVTSLMLSSIGIAIVPYLESKRRKQGGEKPSGGGRLTRRAVDLLSYIAVDARSALELPLSLNGCFNTGFLIRQRRIPLLAGSTSYLGLFNASGTGAASIASIIKSAVSQNHGYAWRYASLLTKGPIPSQEALSSPLTCTTSKEDRLPIAFGLSNLGAVELKTVSGWVEELWILSTVKRDSCWGLLEVNSLTVDGGMSMTVASTEIGNVVLETIAKRVFIGLTGVPPSKLYV